MEARAAAALTTSHDTRAGRGISGQFLSVQASSVSAQETPVQRLSSLQALSQVVELGAKERLSSSFPATPACGKTGSGCWSNTKPHSPLSENCALAD